MRLSFGHAKSSRKTSPNNSNPIWPSLWSPHGSASSHSETQHSCVGCLRRAPGKVAAITGRRKCIGVEPLAHGDHWSPPHSQPSKRLPATPTSGRSQQAAICSTLPNPSALWNPRLIASVFDQVGDVGVLGARFGTSRWVSGSASSKWIALISVVGIITPVSCD